MSIATSSLAPALARDLDELDQATLRRALHSVTRRDGAYIEMHGRRLVDFASNDYLSLASDPRLSHPTPAPFGATASRSVVGNYAVHEELERALARFKGAEAALLFSSGYAANVGVIPALVGREDVIYSDELNHASIIDGCRLSRATVRIFPHRDLGALSVLLKRDRNAFRRRLIVVEGVYSMDGDLFPLDELVPVAQMHDAWIHLDDAHASGVLGAAGAGSADHWGVHGQIEVTIGTLGKAFGTAGAFVAGCAELREILLNRARPFVFSTGTPPSLAVVALAALRIAQAEPQRRRTLHANAERLRMRLSDCGVALDPGSPGHIVPFVLGSAPRVIDAGRRLRDAGFLVGTVRPPSVPASTARLRITVSAAHTTDQIDRFVEALSEVVSVLGAFSPVATLIS